MTAKRYFKREWEEGYFIFDSEKITEKEVDEQIDYDVRVFGDALTGDENVELLNQLHEENEQLQKQLDDNTQFLIKSAKRLGFKSLDHLLYTLDKGEITGYSTANWE